MTIPSDAYYRVQCTEDMANSTQQSVEALVAQLRNELSRTGRPVDVKSFVAAHFPHDIKAGQLLMKAFDARLLYGNLCVKSIYFDGYVSGVNNKELPVCTKNPGP